MQELFMKEMKRIAEKKKMDLVTEFSFSNLGQIYFVKNMKTIANMHVQFARGHNCFDFAKGKRAAESFGHKDKSFLTKDVEELAEVIKYVESNLK